MAQSQFLMAENDLVEAKLKEMKEDTVIDLKPKSETKVVGSMSLPKEEDEDESD